MRRRYIFYYLIWGVSAFIGFLVILFPGKEMAETISGGFNRAMPQVQLKLKPFSPTLGPGIATNASQLSLSNGNEIILDRVSILPALFSFAKEQQEIGFTVEMLNGRIVGMVSGPMLGPVPTINLEAAYSGLKLKNISYAAQGTDVVLSALLEGDTQFKTTYNSIGPGIGTIRLTQCRLQITNAILEQLGIYELFFNNIIIDYRFQKERLEILRCEASGSETDLSMTGDCRIRMPFGKSLLNLKGALQPDPSYLAKFSAISSVASLFNASASTGIAFNITGEAEHPVIGL